MPTTQVAAGDILTAKYRLKDAPALVPAPIRQVFVFIDGGNGFHDTGVVQTFTVPAGVTTIDMQVYGAEGGSTTGGGGGAGVGGKGGFIRASVTVTPGEVLQVYVGGHVPANHAGGGWNGAGSGGSPTVQGSGGGGASDVRRSPYALANRLIVAGGGGGASTATTSGGASVDGGAGGYPTGGTGFNGATGGTQTAGGLHSTVLGDSGTDGALGQGGIGWGTSGQLGRGGGGGGGGLYGGGGGGELSAGGGGSSGIAVGSTLVDSATGTRSGDGTITLTWTPEQV